MNLFRSGDHARRWSGDTPATDAGIVTLAQLASIMGTPRHRDRYTGQYVSSFPGYGAPFFDNLKRVTANDPFWDPTPR